MKNRISYLLILTIVLFSCNAHKDNPKIEGTWHAYKLENALIDSDFARAKNTIDTLGKNNDDKTNMLLYQTTNMDSLRKGLQMQREEAMEVQKNAVKNTIFNLKPNGIAMLSFNGEIDSSKWKLRDDKVLVFTDLLESNKGDSTLMEILTLNDTLLKVRLTKEQDTSVIYFHRESK